jgi:hypothetical protein
VVDVRKRLSVQKFPSRSAVSQAEIREFQDLQARFIAPKRVLPSPY